ncbi:MAG TPA: ABC transporter ATP-binding protein [Gemmataceae bacterium]|nr:ABC transporter ATP-binding protein [Gemmataceae bacterium]
MGDSDTVIRAKGVSKLYEIRHRGADNLSLRDTLSHGIRALGRRVLGREGPRAETREQFWALQDVSFEVKQGEVLGIIGRNGAGKSTLLKVLSRITEPTAGRIEIDGRLASLMEVGTGFHPELTGRENVYLNGAILGMSRAEIRRKFDEIVAFAEVEKFLDTPVRRYSSGMYMRLAFAVAAHLEPEILIVDEVLAVGDAEFQKKCIGKMGQVAQQGRTVLMVSHQLATITNLCSRALLLRSGRLMGIGSAQEIMNEYLKPHGNEGQQTILQHPAWTEPLIHSVGILGPQGEHQDVFALGSDITFVMTVKVPPGRKFTQPVMGVDINHIMFGLVAGVNTRVTGYQAPAPTGSEITMQCRLLAPPLLQGHYTANIWFGNGPADLDVVKDCLSFRMEGADVYGTGQYPLDHLGVMFLRADWQTLESPVAT